MADFNTGMSDAVKQSQIAKRANRRRLFEEALKKAANSPYEMYQLVNNPDFKEWANTDSWLKNTLTARLDELQKGGYVDAKGKFDPTQGGKAFKEAEETRKRSDAELGVKHVPAAEGNGENTRNFAEENMEGRDDGIDYNTENPTEKTEPGQRYQSDERPRNINTLDDIAHKNVMEMSGGDAMVNAGEPTPNSPTAGGEGNGEATGGEKPQIAGTNGNPSETTTPEEREANGNGLLLADILMTGVKNALHYRPAFRTAYGEDIEGRDFGNEKSLAMKLAEENMKRGLERANSRKDYESQQQAEQEATKQKGQDTEYRQARQNLTKDLSPFTTTNSYSKSNQNLLGGTSTAGSTTTTNWNNVQSSR